MSRIGGSLLVLGIMTLVMPHLGLQYNFMSLIEPQYHSYASGGMIVIGLLASIGGAAVEPSNDYQG